MSETPIGGPALAQERKIVTAIPGPKSQEILARKNAARPPQASARRASRLDRIAGARHGRRGRQLVHRSRSIAVTGVGNAAPRVVEAVTTQVQQFTPPASPSLPTTATSRSRRSSTNSPGDFEKRSALFNSGAEALENGVKTLATTPARTASSSSTTPTTAAPTSRWA